MPTPQEIKEKIEELRETYIQDDDYLMDALVENLDAIRQLLFAKTHDDLLWAHDQLVSKIKVDIQSENKLMDEALDALVALEGHAVRVAVDDYQFISHDTRY